MKEGSHLLEVLWKGVNVLAFLGLVYYFGRKHISEAFQRYFEGLTEQLLSSEKDLREAQEELSRAKSSLDEARRRYEEQLKLAQETANSIKEEEEKKAQEMARRIREKAKEVIEIELKRAREELLRYGAERARTLAMQKLKESFSNQEVQSSYIEKSLSRLEVRR
ncbi:MAG: hypothetical protein N3C13_04350 [Aquificaceae bacterium]|nr:hypothetical protein [Aquificaceae bacterium]MCX8060410.1 hypothetical protein [Aquificaceae bacterium]MDW8096530.1 hypothetical protein [Aquificaceae bacterium]